MSAISLSPASGEREEEGASSAGGVEQQEKTRGVGVHGGAAARERFRDAGPIGAQEGRGLLAGVGVAIEIIGHGVDRFGRGVAHGAAARLRAGAGALADAIERARRKHVVQAHAGALHGVGGGQRVRRMQRGFFNARLAAGGLAVRARLVGSTEADPACAARVKALSRARGVEELLDFRGFTEDVAAALRGIPVLVLPSDAEGLPVCVLEAMSLGKLVAASAVGAVPECVEDGRTGFLHPPRDPRALAALLGRLFSAPAAAWAPVSAAAREAWSGRFSEKRMIEGFGRVYRERFGLEAYPS